MTQAQEQERLLRESTLVPEGVLRDASNLTLRVVLEPGEGPAPGAGRPHRAVYKPVRGERPLHDFPTGTLAGREVAAYRISAAGGWDLVPPTVLRDGPLGPGSVQWWVEADEEPLAGAGLVDVVRPEDLEPGWLPVVGAEGARGEPVVVVHADDPAAASLAVLDCVLNNADRKGGHLLLDAGGRLWGIDHGITFHRQDKLRTVLWGWAGDPLPEGERDRLDRMEQLLAPGGDLRAELADLISALEVAALLSRVRRLLAEGTYPFPPSHRYPLPWPLW